jgi:hypothetical protein
MAMQKIYPLITKQVKTIFMGRKGILPVLVMFLSCCSYVNSQTVWNGPYITFTKAGGADWTQAANQDRITDNVWITRANSQGIFNIKTEGSYSHFVSPADTEWATGTLSNYASLSYQSWEAWHGARATPPLNADAVLHLISDNIYIGIRFLSWGGSSGAGFSYSRTTAGSLPVTLKSFSASLRNNSAVLQWKTETEVNNKYFDVEHSSDGVSFTAVGKVNGSGSATRENTYAFTHANISGGKHYYRLAQYDFDGAVKYSQVVLVSLNKGGLLQVKPNPATSFIKLTASTALDGAPYFITSSSGQVVKKGVLSGQQIDVQQLPSGQYWLSVEATRGDALKTGFIKK